MYETNFESWCLVIKSKIVEGGIHFIAAKDLSPNGNYIDYIRAIDPEPVTVHYHERICYWRVEKETAKIIIERLKTIADGHGHSPSRK